MGPREIQNLVREVIRRLATEVGADGRKGAVICVCTGATVGIPEAAAQLIRMVLAGYRLRLALTDSARILYGDVLERELDGLPCVGHLEPGDWLAELRECRAVVVPMLSVNSLSMLSALLASGLAANLMLHALFMGIPTVAAVDGACPDSQGRGLLGFNQGTQELTDALRERLKTAAGYGCRLCSAADLYRTFSEALAGGGQHAATGKTYRVRENILTAGQVRLALGSGCQSLAGPTGMVVTDLALEEAQRNGLSILRG